MCRPTYKNEVNKIIPSLRRVYSSTLFCFLSHFEKTSCRGLLTGTHNPHSGQGSQGGPALGLLGSAVTVSKFLIILSSDSCGVREVRGTAWPPLSTCRHPCPWPCSEGLPSPTSPPVPKGSVTLSGEKKNHRDSPRACRRGGKAFSCCFEQGPCVFISPWAPQMM